YKNAALKLIAGDVHRVQPPIMAKAGYGRMMAASSMPAPQFQEQSFAEYHMYALQGKTDLNNNETKQLSLFNSANIPVKKSFVYEPEIPYYYDIPAPGGDSQKVKVKLEVENFTANQLAMALTKG